MRRLLWALILSFSALNASATEHCKDIDFVTISNEELMERVSVSSPRSSRRLQCGLPGEVLPICLSCSDATTEAMMSSLRPMLGEHGHLEWHSSWHKLRFPISVDDFNTAKEARRIETNVSLDEFKAQHSIGGKLDGEDFLYMHRMMIKMVQTSLARSGLPCMSPWLEIPDLDDANWPLPRRLKDDRARAEAERSLALYRKQLERLRNRDLLKKIPLNRLGQIVEPGLHQNLHNFYRGNPLCSREAMAQGYCDDLLPNETSPLNKHFWKLHGLVDSLIGDWLEANGYQEIAVNCGERPGCYQWRGTWVAQLPQFPAKRKAVGQ